MRQTTKQVTMRTQMIPLHLQCVQVLCMFAVFFFHLNNILFTAFSLRTQSAHLFEREQNLFQMHFSVPKLKIHVNYNQL